MAVAIRNSGGISGLRLGLFIAASVAAHCLLLVAWTRDNTDLPPATQLAVTVIASERSSPVTAENRQRTSADQHDHSPAKPVAWSQDIVATTRPETSADRRTATTEGMKTQQQQPLHQDSHRHANPTPDSGADTTIITNDPTANEPVFSLGQLKQRADEQLHSNFARHFSYPYLAQRRNWQGEVRLGLRIEASGLLSHIHIIKSSGYAILDQAALDSLKKVAAIPGADHWLQGNSFDTVLPVEYRLIDS